MVPAVLMISGALVGEHVLKTQEGRPRPLGLFLFIVAFASLALAVGVGRGARPWDGLDSHYGTAALTVLCWAYLVSDIYVSRTASRLVQMSLFALCVTCSRSTPRMPLLAWSGAQGAVAIEQDILAGVQPSKLVEGHMLQFFLTFLGQGMMWCPAYAVRTAGRQNLLDSYEMINREPGANGIS
jgi:hypothetical protein